MRTNPFESQLERLARTLTEQFGVNVVCQGENAWTDGKQIVLPSVPEPMDEGLERMMVGYLDHEMAHVAFSEFKVAEEFAKRHPGYEGMLNVVEDALIERRAMQRWPGVRANLDALFGQIRDRVTQLIAQRGPFDRFCTAVYLKLAHHNDLIGLDREIVGYEDLLGRFAAVQETTDAAGLAEDLLKRWLSRHPQKCQTPRPGDGNSAPSSTGSNLPSGSGQTGDSDRESASNQGSPSPGDENPQTGDSDTADGPDNEQGSPADEDGSDSQGPAKGSSGQTANGKNRKPKRGSPDSFAGDSKPVGDATPATPSSHHGGTLISEALAGAIADGVSQLSNSTEYRAFTKQYDRIDTVAAAKDGDVQALLATGVDVVRRLRRGLANALRSAEKRWWRDDQVRGSLSPRTLYRLGTDRRLLDVFRVRSTVQGRSTAVCVVLDASGSMTSRKMDVARQAMRVLLESLGDLKIATEAFTFTTGDRFNLAEAAKLTGQDPNQLHGRFSRFGNLEIGLIKQYQEPVKVALRRLPTVRGSGLTPLGEAMQIGAARLSVRPESRRIMLVLTDGKAGCECGDAAAIDHARHVADLCRKVGIELIGVGIQDDSLCAIVADTIVIHELQELPAQLCKLLGRTLQKGLSCVG
ncbi:MAG TPA: VWA domain-containing protein [Phycisphaerae bacterium]|nr:VWA domain-containing protein [Phycisphaerae bacterium]HRY70677.1 VWA domain-containing protein [Phycisphaerae bacterium]HSA28728.1 VWA domain-containing protein [Phycisphaerae bacterium]